MEALEWYARRDSNPRPPDFKSGALEPEVVCVAAPLVFDFRTPRRAELLRSKDRARIATVRWAAYGGSRRGVQRGAMAQLLSKLFTAELRACGAMAITSL